MKGETEQPAFATRKDAVADVQERLGQRFASVNDPDRAGLLDDEQPVKIVRRSRQMDRRMKAVRDQFNGQRCSRNGRDVFARIVRRRPDRLR